MSGCRCAVRLTSRGRCQRRVHSVCVTHSDRRTSETTWRTRQLGVRAADGGRSAHSGGLSSRGTRSTNDSQALERNLRHRCSRLGKSEWPVQYSLKKRGRMWKERQKRGSRIEGDQIEAIASARLRPRPAARAWTRARVQCPTPTLPAAGLRSACVVSGSEIRLAMPIGFDERTVEGCISAEGVRESVVGDRAFGGGRRCGRRRRS